MIGIKRWVLLNIDMDIFGINKSALYDRRRKKMYVQTPLNKLEYKLLNAPIPRHRFVFFNIIKTLKINKHKAVLSYSHRKPPQITIT